MLKSKLEFLDFYLDLEDKQPASIIFFRKDLNRLRFRILILKAYYNSEVIIVEDIIKKRKFISKPSVLKIIKEAVEHGFLEKSQFDSDRRKLPIIPTERTIKEFEEFYSIFKANF